MILRPLSGFSGFGPVQDLAIWLQVLGFSLIQVLGLFRSWACSGLGLVQVLGLAASIAARLTIWPISLACSASDRIWACTYSLCSRMISVKSLACSKAWA